MIICKGEIELPSDIDGLEIYHYKENPAELKEIILKFVKSLH